MSLTLTQKQVEMMHQPELIHICLEIHKGESRENKESGKVEVLFIQRNAHYRPLQICGFSGLTYHWSCTWSILSESYSTLLSVQYYCKICSFGLGNINDQP
jgi:hypothetical protein